MVESVLHVLSYILHQRRWVMMEEIGAVVARRRWEIGAAATPIGTAATPIVSYLTWVWVCVGRVTGQW